MITPYPIVRKKAHDARSKHASAVPPFNPERIAESMGVRVLYADFTGDMQDQMAGFYDVEEKKIYINRAMPANKKTYTIAHELGHHLLHQGYAASDGYKFFPRNNRYQGEKPREEKEADEFAANLLVPLSSLRAYRKFVPDHELSEVFAVSDEVIANRIDRLENG